MPYPRSPYAKSRKGSAPQPTSTSVFDDPPTPIYRERINRVGQVTSWDTRVFLLLADKLYSRGNRMAGANLILHGSFLRPSKGVGDFEITLSPTAYKGEENLTAVGFITKARPTLKFTIFMTPEEIQVMTSTVAAGRELSCAIGFETPRYNAGVVLSFGLGTTAFEDEE